MTGRLSKSELAAIRERDAYEPDDAGIAMEVLLDAYADRRALLAHIDAITEAVENEVPEGALITRESVLALLRGEA